MVLRLKCERHLNSQCDAVCANAIILALRASCVIASKVKILELVVLKKVNNLYAYFMVTNGL